MELKDLTGLIPTEVGEFLAETASKVPAELAIVEIGSFKGKSTCYLASRAQAHVYAIDPWYLPGNVTGRFGYADPATKQAFYDQVALMGFEEKITAIQGFGADVGHFWDKPVGLLFVDGDHNYRSVIDDVRAWFPHLVPGAVIVLDDYATPRNPGVKKAADELARQLGPYTIYAERLAVFT